MQCIFFKCNFTKYTAKLHPRLHHFASFFSTFSRGRPPNPHQREGTPLPYPPHSALRASRTPPPPQVEFCIRHCEACTVIIKIFSFGPVAFVLFCRFQIYRKWRAGCVDTREIYQAQNYNSKVFK